MASEVQGGFLFFFFFNSITVVKHVGMLVFRLPTRVSYSVTSVYSGCTHAWMSCPELPSSFDAVLMCWPRAGAGSQLGLLIFDSDSTSIQSSGVSPWPIHIGLRERRRVPVQCFLAVWESPVPWPQPLVACRGQVDKTRDVGRGDCKAPFPCPLVCLYVS